MSGSKKETPSGNFTAGEQAIRALVEQARGVTLVACVKDDDHDRFTVLLQEPVSERNRNKVIHLLKQHGLQCKVIVYSDNTSRFVNQIFHPVKVKNLQWVRRGDLVRLHVFFHPDDYLEATTAGNKHLARLLLGRFHGISTIKYFSTFKKHQHATKWMKYVTHGGTGQ